MVTYREYQIIQATDFKVLQKRVNDAIKDGWKPIGGIDSNVVDGGVEYLQAMIYERDN